MTLHQNEFVTLHNSYLKLLKISGLCIKKQFLDVGMTHKFKANSQDYRNGTVFSDIK